MNNRTDYSPSAVRLPGISMDCYGYQEHALNMKTEKEFQNRASIRDTEKIQKSSHRKVLSNQYSVLNKYNKINQFMDMEQYFDNLYGEKKQKRLQKEAQIQKQNEKLTLPSIHEKPSFENELLKYKIQTLEERLNRMEPLRVMNNGYPYTGQMTPQPHQMSLCNNCSEEGETRGKNKKPTIFGRTKEERRKMLLRKFRVYGYVVYFCILFPHYSLMFGYKKVERFVDKYLINGSAKHTQMEKAITAKLRTIPMYDFVLEIHSDYEDQKERENAARHKKSKGKKEEIDADDMVLQLRANNSKEKFMINLNIFKKIVEKAMDEIESKVEQFDSEMVEFLGIGTFHNSLYADYTYSIEQLPFVVFNQGTGRVNLPEHRESSLMVSSLMVKRVIFQYLLQLGVNSEWQNELTNRRKIQSQEEFFLKLICKELELCALFLYEMTSEIYYGLIVGEENFNGNMVTLEWQSIPLLRDPMVFPSVNISAAKKSRDKEIIQLEKQKEFLRKQNAMKSKRLIEEAIHQFKGNRKITKEQQMELNEYGKMVEAEPLNLIHNNSHYRQIGEILIPFFDAQYDDFGSRISELCAKMGRRVRKELLHENRLTREQMEYENVKISSTFQILQGLEFSRSNSELRESHMDVEMFKIYYRMLENNEARLETEVQSQTEGTSVSQSKGSGSNYSSSKQSLSYGSQSSQSQSSVYPPFSGNAKKSHSSFQSWQKISKKRK